MFLKLEKREQNKRAFTSLFNAEVLKKNMAMALDHDK